MNCLNSAHEEVQDLRGGGPGGAVEGVGGGDRSEDPSAETKLDLAAIEECLLSPH